MNGNSVLASVIGAKNKRMSKTWRSHSAKSSRKKESRWTLAITYLAFIPPLSLPNRTLAGKEIHSSYQWLGKGKFLPMSWEKRDAAGFPHVLQNVLLEAFSLFFFFPLMILELLPPVHCQPEGGADPLGGTELSQSRGNGVCGWRQLKICLLSGPLVMGANEFLCHFSPFELGFLVLANKIAWHAFTESSCREKTLGTTVFSVVIVTGNATGISWHLH